MSPQRKAGTTFFERRFLFSKDYWISFQKDSWIFSGFSMGRWTWFFFRTLDVLDRFTQEYGSVFRTSDVGFSYGFWTLVFPGFLDLVFLWIVGCWFSFSSGFLDLVFL